MNLPSSSSAYSSSASSSTSSLHHGDHRLSSTAEGSRNNCSKYPARVNLASLLNDPRKIKRDYDLFTKDWGDTFKDLPKGAQIRKSKYVQNIEKRDFNYYRNSINDRFLRHQSQSIKFQKETDDTEISSSVHLSRDGNDVLKSSRTQEAIQKTRRALQALPKIYLRSDFNMCNPNVFATVLSPPKDHSNNNSKHSSSKVLQEKLSHYLDMVEIALVRQISLQSDAFFKAMDSHDMLHSDLDLTLNTVKQLLNKMSFIDQNIVKNSLKVSRLHRHRVNSSKVIEKLEMMATVRQTQSTIQVLLNDSCYASALDLINTTQDVLHQELSGIQCFRHLSSQLKEMENVIGKMMIKDMEELVRKELQRSIKDDSSVECSNSTRLRAVTLGLMRQGKFDFLQGFKDEVETVVKDVIKQTVGEAVTTTTTPTTTTTQMTANDAVNSNSLEEQQEEPTLATRMRMLPYNEWLTLLDRIFDNLIVIIRRITSILDVISELAREHSKEHRTTLTTRRRQTADRKRRRRKARTKANDGNEKPKTPPPTTNPFGEIEEGDEFGGTDPNPFGASSNPFGDVEEEEMMMEGLASYEDQLISDAADAFDNRDGVGHHHNDHNFHKTAAAETSDDDNEEYDYDDFEDQDVVDQKERNGGDQQMEQVKLLIKTIENLMVWTCEFQQDRCVKVINAKGRDGSLDKVSSQEFLQLAKSVKNYTDRVECMIEPKIITNFNSATTNGNDQETQRQRKMRKLTSSLRGALRAQAGKFVNRFHEERRNKLSLLLDNEMWKQAEVPPELHKLVRTMFETVHPVETNLQNRVEAKCSCEFMTLNGEKFAVVGTVLIMLTMISEYCKCCDDFPASCENLIQRLCDLLALFNSRTCQLVLGAGALQLVGLKSITTKHLALASRGLQLVLTCMPVVRHHFRAVLEQQQHHDDVTAVMSSMPGATEDPENRVEVTGNSNNNNSKHFHVMRLFDHVEKNYKDHVREIELKMRHIVGQVLRSQLAQWRVKAPVPSNPFRQICRQLTKFHETVIALLPPQQVAWLFKSVNLEFKQIISSCLRNHKVTNDGGPQHGLVTSDLNYYEKTMQSLEAVDTVDLELYTIWNQQSS